MVNYALFCAPARGPHPRKSLIVRVRNPQLGPEILRWDVTAAAVVMRWEPVTPILGGGFATQQGRQYLP